MVASALVAPAAFAMFPGEVSAAGQVLPGDASWLEAVNFYRTESGLAPVTEDPALSAGAAAHSRYLLTNQVLVHDEVDGAPGWTIEGDRAGNRSNVAVSGGTTPDRQFIELFMAAPYHAIGILRPGISTVGYGRADNAAGATYRSASSLDILSSYNGRATSEPIVFPGRDSTVAIERFIAEYPDPRDPCGWSSERVGLPLIVMLPEAAGSVSASLSGPTGPLDTCVLTAANTTGLANQLLDGDNAVIVVPRVPLANGRYQASVRTSSRTVTWSFGIDTTLRNAPRAALPDTAPTAPSSRFTPLTPTRLADSRVGQGIAGRLSAGSPVRLQVTGTGGVPAGAVVASINVTAVTPSEAGYLTVYPCTASVPDVSTVNFAAGEVAPNHAVAPLDADGGLCLVSSTSTDVLIDVFGSLQPGGAAGYRPIGPTRLADTRSGWGGRLPAGGTLRLPVRGVAGVSSSAEAVVLNVTAVQPSATGYVTAHPCLEQAPTVSNLNLVVGQDRPNLVIVPVSAAGEICLTVVGTATDLLVDLAGELSRAATSTYTPLAPIRITDTRSADGRLNGGTSGTRLGARTNARTTAAGTRGAPAGVAAMMNVTVAAAAEDGYLSVQPCTNASPATSTVNFRVNQTVANASISPVDSSGLVCNWGSTSTHVIVDLVGVWR